MTEAQAQKEFTEDDDKCIVDSEEPVHATSPLSFIFIGLELEEIQYMA